MAAEEPRNTTPARRPPSVVAAAVLLLLQAVWSVLLIAITVIDLPALAAGIRAASEVDGVPQVSVEQADSGASIWVAMTAVVAVLVAVLFVGLAAAALRGSDTGQLFAFIASGIAIPAYLYVGWMCAQMKGDEQWFRTSMIALTVAAVIAHAAALALLRSQASTRYFHPNRNR
jgi:hypothetical protein